MNITKHTRDSLFINRYLTRKKDVLRLKISFARVSWDIQLTSSL